MTVVGFDVFYPRFNCPHATNTLGNENQGIMKNQKTNQNFDKNIKLAGIKNSYGYGFYFENYIFKDLDIKNKSILDLGGGNGIASFYATHIDDSCKCVIVDPFEEGSNTKMLDQYKKMSSIYGKRVSLHNDYVTSLPDTSEFDIVLMHNSINHIGEDLIKNLEIGSQAWKEYQDRIYSIFSRAKPEATIIISDCSNRNFWGDVGIKNPFAPSIEWELHQPPTTWTKMFEDFGCQHLDTQWTSRRELLSLGKYVLANKFFSYFINSHFVAKFKKN